MPDTTASPYVKYPCAACSTPTTHVNPSNGDRGQTRYQLCAKCGGVPPRGWPRA